MEPMEGVVREGFEGLGVKVGGTWEAKPWMRLNLKERGQGNEGIKEARAKERRESGKPCFLGWHGHGRAVSFSQPRQPSSILARSGRAKRHARAKNCRKKNFFLFGPLVRSTGPPWTGPRTEFPILLDRRPDRFAPVRSGFGPSNFQP